MDILPETANSATSTADQALLTEIRARWPILSEAKPLKIGIRQDIRAALDGVSGVRIARAVLLHIATPAYQAALAAGGARYDLNGEPDGQVTAKEQRHAKAIVDGKAAYPTAKRKKPKHKVQPSESLPQSQAQAPPPSDPAPAPPVAPSQPTRPVLKLKPKVGTVTTATISRREPK